MSFSAVDRFIQCPRSYWWSYVIGKKSPSNRGQLVGSLYGKLIEDAHNGRDVDWSTLKRYHANLPVLDREKVDEAALTTVWKLFGLYVNEDGKPPYTGVPEWRFETYLPECGPGKGPVPFSFLGFLDLKRERAISEHKTSGWVEHAEWGWSAEKVDKSYQAALYWWAFLQAEGFEPEECRFHILGTKPPLRYFELVTYPNLDRVMAFRDEAEKLVKAIEAEDFPCTDGKCARPKHA